MYEFNSPVFEMLVGVAGAGKSTFARKEVKFIEELTHAECVICSSDAIRGELWGNESDQREPSKVFQVMLHRTREALAAGKSVIYDAANIEEKYRLQILQQIRPYDCYKVCTVFIERPEVCVERQKLRERKVPEHVIWRQIRKFQPPQYYEGWTAIRIFSNPYNDEEFVEQLRPMHNFDQHNPHHTLTLDAHVVRAADTAVKRNYYYSVNEAALFHDFGKIHTQEFDEEGIAHYYGHENVSAYFYFLLSGKDANDGGLEIAWLISHHMDFFKGERYMEKLRARAGDFFYTALKQLHECDLEAH